MNGTLHYVVRDKEGALIEDKRLEVQNVRDVAEHVALLGKERIVEDEGLSTEGVHAHPRPAKKAAKRSSTRKRG